MTKTKYKQTDSTMFDEIVFVSVFMSFNFIFNNLHLMHKSKKMECKQQMSTKSKPERWYV